MFNGQSSVTLTIDNLEYLLNNLKSKLVIWEIRCSASKWNEKGMKTSNVSASYFTCQIRNFWIHG